MSDPATSLGVVCGPQCGPHLRRHREELGMADLSGSHSRFDSLVQDVRSIILIKRSEAERSVDFHRVATYWKVGQRIVERSKEARTGLHMGQGSSIGLLRESNGSSDRVSRCVSWSWQGSSIRRIRLRTHCVRNRTGRNRMRIPRWGFFCVLIRMMRWFGFPCLRTTRPFSRRGISCICRLRSSWLPS